MRPLLLMVAGKDPLREQSGGHSSYVRAYARAATAAGWRPEIFCVSDAPGECETPYGLVRRVRTPLYFLGRHEYTSVRSRHAGWHVPLLLRAVRRRLAASDEPAILHGFSIWGVAAVAAARKARRRGRPARSILNVYTVFSEEYRSKWEGARPTCGFWGRLGYRLEWWYGANGLARLERFGDRRADRLLANYDSVRRFVERAYGPAPRLRIFPYAAETAFLPDLPPGPPPEGVAALEPREAPLLLTVSRHDPRKGLDIFLDALTRLREWGVPFRAAITSGGELLDAHRRRAARLGLPPRQVVFTGYVADTREWLRAADVFCLPSLEEHSGSVALLEALQAGRAAVVSRVDGLPEDVEHEVQALLVPPRDPAALAAALRRLIEDRPLRDRLAAAARVRFEERFSAARLTAAVGELYERTFETPPS